MNARDLTKEPPRSPRVRLSGFVILARAIDKCRAEVVCRAGDYHFDCPLDRLLFAFKRISSFELRQAIMGGYSDHSDHRDHSDEAIGAWVNAHGTAKSPAEIKAWSDGLERYSLLKNPAKRDFFMDECRRLGLDPQTATMFDWLEADDLDAFQIERAWQFP